MAVPPEIQLTGSGSRLAIGAGVGQAEVAGPLLAVSRAEPLPGDRRADIADSAGEPLAEIERREIGFGALEWPGAAVEGHLVEPRDAAGVEIVLHEPAVVSGDDDTAAVRCLRDWHRRALHEHVSHHVEHDVPADVLAAGQVSG